MQQFWWRDLRDLEDKWVGLSIEVNRPKSSKPPLHLQSGNNGRMKLMLNESPLFWATIATSYYGAWLVRNPRPVQLESPSVPPIVSADVQEHFELPVQERFPRWCRYFINQLMNNQADFLYPGHWVARPLLPAVSRYKPVAGPDGWYFSTPAEASSHLPNWYARGEGILDNVQPHTVHWLDWDLGHLIGLHTVDPFAGRLKWWRKKAREGSLPPILLWYVGGLCSYVIIDGHYRLQAALDEGVKPDFIVLSSTKAQQVKPCEATQQRVFGSLMLQNARHPKFNVHTFNQALINTFDDRPWHWAGTHAWAGIPSDQAWCAEVTSFLTEQGNTDHLQDIIERCEY
ncbi:ParB/Srx family N-terminal domain-containing protein [Pseudomonas siliginis]|uniref:ParB/Srx family N-terminal domain-containing protein n=1 Tax=Pseudomonas siliginis TaxID=2842346 RepID=UPI0020931D53|nr:ParB/Srx family N-terminal domain-containing protein [Pseudomonas siliginis]UST99064.1 ParB/Srx family N-terminal domain-containing protein [Pseudomonas siliginis]